VERFGVTRHLTATEVKLIMGKYIPEYAKIAVIGLGYVGLPLALAFARQFPVIGFDTSENRIQALAAGNDRTGEVTAADLEGSSLSYHADAAAIAGQDVYIITVPTPVDAANKPDLSALLAACELVGRGMVSGAVVVIESTVYPGVTQEICGPALACASGLKAGQDFYLGYSPERINPGDGAHGLAAITKVVAGDRPELTTELAALYGGITASGVFAAADIETAEAAKVIENAQRDINIAFINEIALICEKLDLSAHQVLAAAGSKWNFLPFKPGLVGGHCIGVDPFYLAHRAMEVGHQPEMILAGRKINDAMGRRLAELVCDRLPAAARVLVMGLTFKENVRDLRNSKVADLVAGMADLGLRVDVYDPNADADQARQMYDVDLLNDLSVVGRYDAILPAVPHREFLDLEVTGLLADFALIADIKGIWQHRQWPDNIRYWLL
jgi:UDP-N-acetyl-D-galactosamine dehydrogenase